MYEREIQRLNKELQLSLSNKAEWEKEMETLRSNNLLLTSALKESMICATAWQTYIRSSEDENLSMANQIQSFRDLHEQMSRLLNESSVGST